MSECMESMMTFVSGNSSAMRLVAAMPSRSGMVMSRMAMSGLRDAMPFNAATPLSASPTTSNSSGRKMAFIPLRRTGWSSAMKIFVFFMFAGKRTVSVIIMRARGKSKDLLGLSLIDDLSQGLDDLGPRYYGLDLVLVKGLVLYERD